MDKRALTLRGILTGISDLIGNVDHSVGNGANSAKMRGEMLNSIRDIAQKAVAEDDKPEAVSAGKHTPWPWTSDPEGAHAVAIEGADGSIVCYVEGASNDPRCEANIRLILDAVESRLMTGTEKQPSRE